MLSNFPTVTRALKLLEEEKLEDALLVFDEAARLGEDPPERTFGQAITLIQLDRLTEALPILERFVATYPEYPDGLGVLNALRESMASQLTLSPNEETGERKIHLTLSEIQAYADQKKFITLDDYLERYPGHGSSEPINWIEFENDAPPLKLRRVPDVCILGPKAALVTKYSELLRESTIYSHVSECLDGLIFNELDLGSSSILRGEYLPLCGIWSDAFWHWIFDYLPAVVIAEAAGFKGRYLLPNNDQRFIKESLDLLGIDEQRCIKWNGSVARLETLYMPTKVSGGTNLHKYPGVTHLIRNRLLQGAGAPNTSSGYDRIYIARRAPVRKRRVVNEIELLTLLDRWGFKSVELENFALSEQIRIMSSANVVVAPHGAGLTHTLFMQPQSLVLEIFPPTYINPCILPVAEHLRHRYFMAVDNYDVNGQYPYGEDILAPLELIRTTLQRELT